MFAATSAGPLREHTSTPEGPVSPYLKGCLYSTSAGSFMAAGFKHTRKTTYDISPRRHTLQTSRGS